MQNDNSAWSSDPAWIAEREQKWPIFEAYKDKHQSWSEDFPREEQVAAYRNYYLYGEVNSEHNWWSYLALLHPDATEATIRGLMLSRKPRGRYYGLHIDQTRQYELVESGFLDAGFPDRYFVATTGRSYDEAMELIGKPKLKGISSRFIKAQGGGYKLQCNYPRLRYSPLVVEIVLQHFADLLKLYRPEYVSEEEWQFARDLHFPSFFKIILTPNAQQDPYLKHIVDKVTACFVADDCPEPLRSYALEQLNLKP